MPFWLTNAPAVFQNWLTMSYEICSMILFAWMTFKFSKQEHVVHLRQVLQRLLENQLLVTTKKCEFHVSKVSFLGYILNAGNIQMDPAKTGGVTKDNVSWPLSTSIDILFRTTVQWQTSLTSHLPECSFPVVFHGGEGVW